MAYTPLAQVTDLTNTPLGGIVTKFSAGEESNLLTRASMAIEDYCDRRLAPFTNLIETYRAELTEPDEALDSVPFFPLDTAGTLGMSRAASLSATELCRYLRLKQRPPVLPDYWQGSITSILVTINPAGQITLPGGQLTYFVDTGLVRFPLGTFVPIGSMAQVTYSGGYQPTVPGPLVQATILKAAELALLDLSPQQRPNIDLTELRDEIASLVSPYLRG